MVPFHQVSPTTILPNTCLWNFSPNIHQYGSCYGVPKVMGFCSFSCWKCLCSTLPLKEIPERHYCMLCPSYTTSILLQFIFFELVFSFEILMPHLFVNSCGILPDKLYLSYLKSLFQINFFNPPFIKACNMNVVGCGYL